MGTDTPTTRVHAPPGGRSSICLGGDSAEPSFDRNSLACLKKRMSKKQALSSQSTCVDSSASSVQPFLKNSSAVDVDVWRGGHSAVFEEAEEDDLPLGAE